MPAHMQRRTCATRAGSTIAELCAAAKPSLLVPLATAADDHQRKNAEVLAEAGAAVMLLQKDVTQSRYKRIDGAAER